MRAMPARASGAAPPSALRCPAWACAWPTLPTSPCPWARSARSRCKARTCSRATGACPSRRSRLSPARRRAPRSTAKPSSPRCGRSGPTSKRPNAALSSTNYPATRWARCKKTCCASSTGGCSFERVFAKSVLYAQALAATMGLSRPAGRVQHHRPFFLVECFWNSKLSGRSPPGVIGFFVVAGLNWTSGIVALQQIVEPIVTGLRYALVEIERSAGGLLRVTIDLPWPAPHGAAAEPAPDGAVASEPAPSGAGTLDTVPNGATALETMPNGATALETAPNGAVSTPAQSVTLED